MAIIKMTCKQPEEKWQWLGSLKKYAQYKSHQLKNIRESTAANRSGQNKRKLDKMTQKAL